MSIVEPSVVLAVLSAGAFLLMGLLIGVWKYVAIMRSPEAAAPVYVDIAHRASLMYAFASQLLALLAWISALPATLEFWATAMPILFFALAIATYIVHGILDDTDNQLARPHRLGDRILPGPMIQGFMIALILAELGGAVILFYGAAIALLGEVY